MSGERSILAPTIVVVLSLLIQAKTNAISYAPPRDFVATSPNGEFSVVGDYPDDRNWRNNPTAHASFKLIDNTTGKSLWQYAGTRDQLEDQLWPGAVYGAYVGNSGNVLVHGPPRVLLTPISVRNGMVGRTMRVDFEPHRELDLSKDRPAPLFWQVDSFRAVIEIQHKSYLLIQTRWGARKLVDFLNHEIIDVLTAEQNEACNRVAPNIPDRVKPD